MDRESLQRLLDTSPIRVLMNDRKSYTIDDPRQAIVDDISCERWQVANDYPTARDDVRRRAIGAVDLIARLLVRSD